MLDTKYRITSITKDDMKVELVFPINCFASDKKAIDFMIIYVLSKINAIDPNKLSFPYIYKLEETTDLRLVNRISIKSKNDISQLFILLKQK